MLVLQGCEKAFSGFDSCVEVKPSVFVMLEHGLKRFCFERALFVFDAILPVGEREFVEEEVP